MEEERPTANTRGTGANPEHLAILKQGAKAWNRWREENPGIVPNLRGLNLDKRTVGGTKLCECNLAGANLRDVILEEADLSEARLMGANVSDAKLRGANLVVARLKGAVLCRVNLTGAQLVGADLQQADLKVAELTGADMNEANLERADLRGVRGLRLNSTYVRQARFSSRARDPWSVLRRGYTGPKLFFNILFLAAFLMPYVVKTAGWVMLNRTQEQIRLGVEKLQGVAGELEAEEHRTAQPMRAVLAAVSEQLPIEGSKRWRESRIWRVVLGVDRGASYWLTAVLLIVYNVCRAVLTWFVGPMRDEEERSGHTPQLRGLPARSLTSMVRTRGWRGAATWLESWPDAYFWLFRVHQVLRVLFWFAVASFVWHAVSWLALPVWIPAR
jgi:uncharacterized protein YjbI with pentapeptide repeats